MHGNIGDDQAVATATNSDMADLSMFCYMPIAFSLRSFARTEHVTVSDVLDDWHQFFGWTLLWLLLTLPSHPDALLVRMLVPTSV